MRLVSCAWTKQDDTKTSTTHESLCAINLMNSLVLLCLFATLFDLQLSNNRNMIGRKCLHGPGLLRTQAITDSIKDVIDPLHRLVSRITESIAFRSTRYPPIVKLRPHQFIRTAFRYIVQIGDDD